MNFSVQLLPSTSLPRPHLALCFPSGIVLLCYPESILRIVFKSPAAVQGGIWVDQGMAENIGKQISLYCLISPD